MDYINIGIIGGNKYGKKTFINALCASDSYNKELKELIENSNIIDDFTKFSNNNIIPNIQEINYNEEKFCDIAKQNIDLYIVISKNGILNTEKLNIIEDAVNKNKNGKIIVLHNEFNGVQKEVQKDEHKEEHKEVHKDEQKDEHNIEKSYTINMYSLFLHTRLYYSYNNDNVLPKTTNDLKNLVKTLIGDLEYKKNKTDLETLAGMQKYLQNKECDKDIYDNAMCELGFNDIKDAISDILSSNYDNFYQKHIELKISNWKNDVDLLLILDDIDNIIHFVQNKESECYNNIMSFISDNLVAMLNHHINNPTNISLILLNKLETINKTCGNLTQIIDNLKNLRKENLIDIFKEKFDFDLMKEINGKLTMEILKASLDNTITDEFTFESYLIIFDNISLLTNNDINYIALVAKYFNKFIKSEHKIFKYNLTKKILNEKDKRVEYVLWQICDNVKQPKFSDENISFESFNECNKLMNKFYDIITNVFDEPNSIEEICDYFSECYEYDFYVLAMTNIINSLILTSNCNFRETFRKIQALHENDELDKTIKNEKSKLKNSINVPLKYEKISKFIYENYILLGDKKESCTVKNIFEEFKIWFDNHYKSKFNFEKKDIIDFFEYYSDIVEVKKDVVFGLKKYEEDEEESDDECSNNSESSSESVEICSSSKKQTITIKK